MKTYLNFLWRVAVVSLLSSRLMAANAPGDIRMEQRNSQGNAWPYIIFPTSANSLIGTDANGRLSIVTAGDNITIAAGVISSTGGGGGGGAPTTATYITQTPNASLSAEQPLSALSSGIMRVANATGVVTSITDSAGIATNINDESGTGSLVFATSPTLVTPNLGTPSVAILTNATGLPISTGVAGLGANVATFLATPTSANLASAVTGETGTGAVVFGTSPTIATPVVTGAISFEDDVRQTFNPGSTNAGVNTGAHTSDPSSLSNGDLWYNSVSNELKARINGSTTVIGSGGNVTATNNFGVDNSLIRADGVNKAVQSSGIIVDDSNNVTGMGNLTISGNITYGTQSGVPLYATGTPTFTSTTGSGVFVRATSPTLVTPVIGVATGTSLALTGAFSADTASFTTFTATNLVISGSVTWDSNSGVALYASGTPTFTGTTGSSTFVRSTSPTITTPTLSGIVTTDGANVTTANAMSALVIDTTKGLNTKTIAADSTFTFSGTPAASNTWFALYVTNSDASDHVATIPSSVPDGSDTGITTITIPTHSKKLLTWRWNGFAYDIFGSSGSGAPSDATYITQTASGSLSAEQALSSLSTGLMQVTTATGVITSVTTSSGVATLISDETGSGALMFGTSPAFTTNLTLATGTSPTTGVAGAMAFDTNAWATSFGAVQVHNGTASTYLVGVEASDTPSNGQVPVWNTGGTVTWETQATGAPTTATYITQTSDGTLSNEQALASLSTGIMRVATTTGVVTSLTDSSGIAANISDETGSGALVFGTAPTISAASLTGIVTTDGANVTTANAMGAFAIDVTKGLNTKSISQAETFTFSGTPASSNTWFAVAIKNTDSSSHVATIPSSKLANTGTTVTTVSVPASDTVVHLTWRYDGTDYWVYGAESVVFGTDINYPLSVYGAGTAYSLTNTAAAIDFGTTDPTKVLDKAGTYMIFAQVNLAYTGATVVAETATIKVRRTNNTAADLSAVVVLDLPVATTLTHTYGIFQIPPFTYTTASTTDSISIFANVSAGLGVGTIDATAIGTSILAVKLY